MRLHLLLLFSALIFLPAVLRAQGRLRQTELDSGRIDKGHKLGIWSYYALTASGRKVLVQRYDHDQRKLLYYRKPEDRSYRYEFNGDWLSGHLDRPPLFLGGEAFLATFMRQLT